MNLHTPNERLTRSIAQFAEAAMTSRQVAKRLHDLLPLRLHDLKREHGRQAKAVARSERLALSDTRYENHVEELTAMRYAAMQARIEYETHLMLFQARQSLRRFVR